jgi:integrase
MTVYLRPGSPNYQIEFELRGQRIRQSSGTPKRREAEEIERDLRRQLKEQAAAGGIVSMTLAEAMRRYAETVVKLGRSDGSRELSVFKRLGEAFGPDTPLDKITAPVVHRWRDGLLSKGHRGTPPKKKKATRSNEHRSRGLKPAAINRYLDVLKAILRKAHFEWGALLRLPAIKGLKVKNAKLRFLVEEEERRLLYASQEHLRRLLVFLLGTGARRGEALSLTWDAVELDGNRRAAVQFRETKTGVARRVPLPEQVRELLMMMMRAQAPKGEQRVFVWKVVKDGKEEVVPFDSVKRSFDTARAAAKLKGVSLHTMRHTYASRLVMRGVPIYNVSKLLGHSKIQMTMRYAHLAPEGLEESVAVLDASASRGLEGSSEVVQPRVAVSASPAHTGDDK